MYARQPPDGRFPRNMRIPRNYSGNAFRQEEPPQAGERNEPNEASIPSADVSEENALPAAAPAMAEESAVPDSSAKGAEAAAPAGRFFPSPGFKLDLGRLFGRDHSFGIGFEELLIIGLIFLISQNNSKDDLIFLLLLLLFIQ